MTASLVPTQPASMYSGPTEVEGREDLTHDALRRMSQATDPQTRAQLADEVVLLNMGVAQSIARRYRQRGAEFDDLVQVAQLGLVKAVERYDPASASHFLAFAVPTITGEVKRYFRDYCWTIRPTRRIQEIQHAIAAREPELTQTLGRAPTVAEFAHDLGIDEEHALEALASDGLFNLVSLDVPAGWDDPARSVGDDVGEEDRRLAWVENHELLAPALATLSERERTLLWLRFEKGWKQTEIAAELGISQMQVSRLLSALLRRLRDDLTDDGREAAVADG